MREQRWPRAILAFWLLVMLTTAGARADEPALLPPTTRPVAAGLKPVYVSWSDIDWAALLPGPPVDDSPQHRAEVATLLQWQEKRTSQDVSRCRSEQEVTVFAFADVLGDRFNARSLPVTAELMDQASVDALLVSNAANQKWKRLRPPLADRRIRPCVKVERTASYPSGHATRGILWATVLAEIFPDQKEVLMARGRLIGQHRVIGGIDYPSDVEAGQQLGAAIAQKMLESANFKQALDRAKEECLALRR